MPRTFGGRTIPALAFCVAVALAAPAAGAGERFPPPPPGEGWRTLAGDGSVVTSQCIGELSSPTCIVDTMIACDAWSPAAGWPRPSTPDWIGGVHPVCDVLRAQPGDGGYGPSTFLGSPGHAGPKDRIYFYRAVPFTITEEMIPWFADDPDYPLHWQAGDVAVAVPMVRCLPKPACRLTPLGEKPIRYRGSCPLDDCKDLVSGHSARAPILREHADGWTIVSIFVAYRDATWPYLDAFYRRIR